MTFPLLVACVLSIALVAALAAWLTRRWAVAGFAGSAAILLLHSRAYFGYTSDDAYISYRYARHLSDGLGPVWNPGEYVEGYSNFLWMALLAGTHRIGADLVFTGRWVGFGLALVALTGAYVLSRELLPGEAGRIAGFIAMLLLAASGPFALWAAAGLETSLFAVLILAGALLHLRESRGAPPLSGAAWAFVAMTRPDGPLFFAVSAVFKCGEAIHSVRSAPAPDRSGVARREAWRIVLWMAIFAALYVPYFVWRFATYDYVFPNTYYAKVGDGLDQYERGLLYLATFVREYAIWLLALVPLAAVLAPLRRHAGAYLLALALVWFAYVVYVGGDSLVRFRLFAPLLPVVYSLIAASAAAIIQRMIAAGPRPSERALAAVAAATVAALLLFTLQSSATDRAIPIERAAVDDRVEIGRWLRETMPGDTTAAVIPAGAIPYESRLFTIDMLGINDEHIAHRDLRLGGFAAGHEKYDSEYVLDRAPDIIILTDALDTGPRPREQYERLLGGVVLARIDMITTPRLWDEYEARSVEIAEGRWLNLLVRNGAREILAETQSPAP